MSGAERELARRFVVRMARDENDEAVLLDVLFGTGRAQQHRGLKGRPAPEEKSPRPSRATKPERKHGTARMYRWEIAQGIEPCQPCRDAIAALRKQEREKAKAAQEAAVQKAIDDAWTDFGRLQPHGTIASYQRHLRLGDIPCRACCDAQAAYMRSKRPQRKRRAANTACGADGGYYKHLRHHQKPCEACCVAHATERRAYRRTKKEAA